MARRLTIIALIFCAIGVALWLRPDPATDVLSAPDINTTGGVDEIIDSRKYTPYVDNPPGDQTGTQGTSFSIDLSNHLDCGDDNETFLTHSWSVSGNPTGTSIGSTTGVLSGVITGAVGEYDVTATCDNQCTGDGCPSDTTGDVTFLLTVSGGGGFLQGETASVDQTDDTDLASVGTEDWMHWGLSTAGDVNEDATPSTDMTGLTSLVQAPTRFVGDTAAVPEFSWTGGTPTATESGTAAGIYWTTTNAGWRLVVPAGTTTQYLRVFATGFNSTSSVTATLSDGSSAAYSTTLSGASSYPTAITIGFRAGSASQTLTVEHRLTTGDNIGVWAAVLTTTDLLSSSGGTDLDTCSGDTCYFVAATGNDSNAGTSSGAPWLTLSKVKSTVSATGANVYLRRGDSWQETLEVDWNGTSGNRVVIGCYYLDAGNSDQATSCDEGTAAKSLDLMDPESETGSDMPSIIGTFDSACRTTVSSSCTGSGTVPGGSQFTPMVNIAADYVTVENIRVADSNGAGIRVQGQNGDFNFTIIDGVIIENTLGQGFYANRPGAQNGIIRGSIHRRTQYCLWRIPPDTSYQGSGLCSLSSGAGGGIAIVDMKPSYWLVENNTVYLNAGEGVSCSKCSYAVFRGNRVGNVSSSVIYANHAEDMLIEHNLVWDNETNALDNRHSDDDSNNAISLGTEETPVTANSTWKGANSEQLVRNNIMVGFYDFSTMGFSSTTSVAEAAGIRPGGYFVGNTVLSTGIRPVIEESTNDGGVEDIYFRNNVIVSDQTAADICRTNTINGTRTHSNNHWTTTPSVTACQGTNDENGDADLATDIADASTFSYNNIPTLAEFALGTSSGADEEGIALTSTLTWMASGNWDWIPSNLGAIAHAPSVDTTWRDAILTRDAAGTTRGSPPDIGALED